MYCDEKVIIIGYSFGVIVVMRCDFSLSVIFLWVLVKFVWEIVCVCFNFSCRGNSVDFKSGNIICFNFFLVWLVD